MKKATAYLPLAVLVIGVVLTVRGFMDGENDVIKSKGVIVCTECIGIGDDLMPPFYEFRVK